VLQNHAIAPDFLNNICAHFISSFKHLIFAPKLRWVWVPKA